MVKDRTVRHCLQKQSPSQSVQVYDKNQEQSKTFKTKFDDRMCIFPINKTLLCFDPSKNSLL